jgi:hypothetical protein
MQTKTIELIQTLMQSDGANSIHQISSSIQSHQIKNRTVEVSKLLPEAIVPIGIECSHDQITKLLDFTGVTPYEIWYFDDEKQFTGKTFSFQKGRGTFRVETQARFILPWNTKEDKDTTQILQYFKCKEYIL